MNLKITVASAKVVIFFTLKSNYADNSGATMKHSLAALLAFLMAQRTTVFGQSSVTELKICKGEESHSE